MHVYSFYTTRAGTVLKHSILSAPLVGKGYGSVILTVKVVPV